MSLSSQTPLCAAATSRSESWKLGHTAGPVVLPLALRGEVGAAGLTVERILPPFTEKGNKHNMENHSKCN